MAEIKIQERKRPVWPWIVAIIIIGLIVWFLLPMVTMDNRHDNETNRDTVAAGSNQQEIRETGTRNEINNFCAFVQQNDTANYIEAGYVREGLNHLNSAIKAIISDRNISDSSIVAQSDSLDKFTNDIKNEAKQSDNVRTAFVSAANILQKIQRKEEPDLSTKTDDLLKNANALNGKETITEQSSKVKQFFNNAREILQSIANKEV